MVYLLSYIYPQHTPLHANARSAGASGQSRHVMHQVVTQYNRDTNALIRRRIRVGSSGGAAGSGPGAAGGLVQVRVPPAPLPLSWGRTVRPYEEEEQHPPCSGGLAHEDCAWGRSDGTYTRVLHCTQGTAAAGLVVIGQ